MTCETCRCNEAFAATLREVANQARLVPPDLSWPKGKGMDALWSVRQQGIITTLNRLADKIEAATPTPETPHD
jgi:hypothetical protein